MIQQYETELIFALFLLAFGIGTQAWFQPWRRPKDFVKLTITYAVIVLLILSTRY